MHARVSASALLLTCFALACGGGEDAPPLDEMALRDTLLAEPSVIAQLRADVRQRLRTRFSAERLRVDATTEIPLSPNMPFANQMLAMDATRFGAGRDALLTGTWQLTAQTARAVAFIDAVADHPAATLPPLDGDLSGDTILMEQRALAGEAGAVVEQLLKTTSSQRVERVVSWPIAALAANGTVYVNAAWLTAMDRTTSGCSGGGSNPGGSSGQGPTAGAQGGSYMYLVGGEGAAAAQEGEASGELGEDHDGLNHASGFGNCSGSSCSSTTNSCNSACNNTSSACNSASSSCSNYCNDPTGDKACCRACAMSSAAPVSPIVAYGALFWLMLPLGFLMALDGRNSALRRLFGRVRNGMRP